jgi:predicted YcjX-like family ATPase
MSEYNIPSDLFERRFDEYKNHPAYNVIIQLHRACMSIDFMQIKLDMESEGLTDLKEILDNLINCFMEWDEGKKDWDEHFQYRRLQ